MVAESGAPLLDPNAKAALIERVLPRATVVTPEPRRGPLAGRGGGERAAPARSPRWSRRWAPTRVIVTGGHTEDGADTLYDGSGTLRIEGPRFPGGASHGSGCTHSSSLAAFLARG